MEHHWLISVALQFTCSQTLLHLISCIIKCCSTTSNCSFIKHVVHPWTVRPGHYVSALPFNWMFCQKRVEVIYSSHSGVTMFSSLREATEMIKPKISHTRRLWVSKCSKAPPKLFISMRVFPPPLCTRVTWPWSVSLEDATLAYATELFYFFGAWISAWCWAVIVVFPSSSEHQAVTKGI